MKMNKRIQLAKVKEFSKNQKEMKDLLKEDYKVEKDEAIINIDCEKIDEYYNPLSMNKGEVSKDITEYIDTLCYSVPVIYPIKLELHNCKLDNNEQENFSRSIKKYYYRILEDKKLDMKINFIKSLLLFLFGAIMLTLSFALINITSNSFINEFMSIIATFSLWEAVDYYIIERNQVKIQYLNAGQQAMMQICFK